MNGMFNAAIVLKQPLGNWNTRKVTNMNCIFLIASAFNPSLENWDTSNVQSMDYVFHFAVAFNQPLELEHQQCAIHELHVELCISVQPTLGELEYQQCTIHELHVLPCGRVKPGPVTVARSLSLFKSNYHLCWLRPYKKNNPDGGQNWCANTTCD